MVAGISCSGSTPANDWPEGLIGSEERFTGLCAMKCQSAGRKTRGEIRGNTVPHQRATIIANRPGKPAAGLFPTLGPGPPCALGGCDTRSSFRR